MKKHACQLSAPPWTKYTLPTRLAMLLAASEASWPELHQQHATIQYGSVNSDSA